MKQFSLILTVLFLIALGGNLAAQSPDCDPPVIMCPTQPFELTMCGSGTVCIDIPVEKAVTVTAPFGEFTKGDQFCFGVDTSGTYIFTIIASNECGADTCEITAYVTINEAPVIDCPMSEFSDTLCESDSLCLDLPITDADEVTVENAVWTDGRLCFYADTAGVYTFNIVATNGCGSDECDIVYNVELLEPPMINCPEDTVDVFLCDPVGVAMELIIDYEETVEVQGDAVWMNDTLYFETGASGLYEFAVIATNICGADTCDIAVNVSIGTEPEIDCPEDTINMLLCQPEEICVELPIHNPGTVSVYGGGTWENDTLCFPAETSGQYDITVIATDICGADTCDITFIVEIVDAPEIDCPDGAIDTTICQGEYFCIPIPVIDADTVIVTEGIWKEDCVEFLADESGQKTSTIIATNPCGADTCLLTVNLTVALPPVPCFTLDSASSSRDPVTVYFGNCTEISGNMEFLWDFGDGSTSTEFEPAHSYDSNGLYDVSLTVSNECGSETLLEEDFVLIYNAQVVIPTTEWINIYCAEPALDDVPLAPGDIIAAYDPDSVLCGMGMVKESGAYGFIPIYRDDPYSEEDEGAEPGDIITIEINFNQVYTSPVIVWEENGDRIEVCLFFSENCIEISLDDEWNLISWNVAYQSNVEDFILGWEECVDIIMSFDQGGLTYKPDLPEYSTLTELDYYHGYWFKMDCPYDLLICAGEIDPEDFIPVYTGWNLVSYWPKMSYTVEEGFASILDFLLVALGYDGGGQTWLPEILKFNSLTDLYPGLGYWVKLSQNMNLYYPGFGVPTGAAKLQSRPLADGIIPTQRWISLYGKNIAIDETRIQSGSKIEVYSNQGVLCGSAEYDGELLKFTPVYGFDNMGGISSGYPKEGETVSILVNGMPVYPEITWNGSGNCIDISNLYSKSTGNNAAVPDRYSLSQNYPNPFNPNTIIKFAIPSADNVTLSVYNLLGRKVKILVNDYYESGEYEIGWDGTDSDGNRVSSGVYFYRLEAGDFVQTKKMILTK